MFVINSPSDEGQTVRFPEVAGGSSRELPLQKRSVRSVTMTLGRACVVVALAACIATPCSFAEKPAKKAQQKSPPPRIILDGENASNSLREGGKGRTSLFGLVGEGYKFVYVFDRSGSMGGEGRESLKAVKAELIKSLEQLDTVHQFQIVFYNERSVVFNPSGTGGQLAFGTDENKQRAARFLDKIQADGGTDHEQALRMAIRMHPDVIFFLTDADDPKLTPAQLDRIRDLAVGTIINCVEFGPGEKPEGTTFIETLAKQTGGSYVYIDITKHKVDK